MSEPAAALRICAIAMWREADDLEARVSALSPESGSGAWTYATAEAQRRLARVATEFTELRRRAGDALMSAAYAVDQALTPGVSGPTWAAPTSSLAGLGLGLAVDPRLTSIAEELRAIPTPDVLEVSRSMVLPAIGASLFAGTVAVGGFLLWRAGRDVLTTPIVRPLSAEGPEGSDAAKARLDASRPATVAELVAGCADVDTLGQQERAVVDIAKVTSADGVQSWVITLPSTQDWVVFDGDAPAPNDLDAILALALLPGFACAVSKGVEEAVRQAGIPAGASVLLVGFSLGGMVAADLARAGIDDVSVEGVIAAGAPIDTAEDPPGMPVLSLVHEGDTVPALDLAPEGDGPLRTTITDSVAEGVQAHSAAAYAATASAHDADGSLSSPYARFLATSPDTTVEHVQYEIIEPVAGAGAE